MRVQVRLRREAGEYRQPYGLGHTATGDLHLTHRTADGRRVPLLQLLGANRQWPSLFEPRLVSLMGSEFSFIGLERHDRAWVLQQWDCELL
jgi:hypothetical protein